MKTLLPLVAALLALCGIASAGVELSEDQKQLMKQLRTACMAETGVDEATIDACKSGQFADDPKLKCYLKCTYQQMTVMDDDGAVDADMMLSMLPESIQPKAEPILNACKDLRGADACDSALVFNKCLYEKAPEYYMVV
ncbi:General odorant-binding protein 83a [Frankliniella fusca]|uniref:General odorant-binding protein 83a n=1 Tax=Frankliniella fusca TaxID=407009 RepID=A0AAE1HSK5_9NEOP|nr:General odorant-binding protein 83a [Frankliniella fusca]